MKKLKSIIELMTEFPESYFDKDGWLIIPNSGRAGIRSENLSWLGKEIDNSDAELFPSFLFKKPERRIKAYAYIDTDHGEIRKFTKIRTRVTYNDTECAPDFDEYWDENK